MKQYSFLFSIFLLVSCSHDTKEIMQENNSNILSRITMTATDFELESSARTSLKPTVNGLEFTWAENDTVGIFPSSGDQVSFPMSMGADTKTASFDGGGWALKSSSKYAAYYPFNRANYNRSATSILLDYIGQKQIDNATTAHLGKYDYMAANASTPENGKASFLFKHLNSVLQLKLTMPIATSFQSLTLTTGQDLFATSCELNLLSTETTTSIWKKRNNITLDLENIQTTSPNQDITLYLMLAPVDLSGQTLFAEILDTNGNSYAATFEGKNMERGKAYSYSAAAKVSESVNNIILSSAGTLLKEIGVNNINSIKKLKITGDINGDDILVIRRMDKLEYLDLQDSRIVEGGSAYYESYKTKNDILGGHMFYRSSIKHIICPINIVEIGEYCFDFSSLKSIKLFDKIKKVSTLGFSYCKLTEIEIPSSVETIGYCAFISCNSLTSVILHEGIKSIGESAFQECSSLTSISIPETVTNINTNAFDYCKSLKEIHIKALPTTLTDIGSNAFKGSYQTATLYIPKGTREAYAMTELGRFTNIIEE